MPLLDEQDKDKMQQSTQTVQPVQPAQPAQAAQQPQSAAPQVRPAVAGQQTQRPSRGTGFMGIKRVLGASQGARVGQGVTSRLQSAGEAARTGLAEAKRGFEQKATEESERLGTQSRVARGALENIGKGTFRAPVYTGTLKEKFDQYKRQVVPMDSGPNSANAAFKKRNEENFLASLTPEEKQQYDAANAAASIPSQREQEAFQSIASGQLQSPMGLEQAEELRIKAEQAGRLGALAGTQSGRQELLRQQFAQRGGYGAKQSALDALILGKTAGRELAQARSGLAGIGREVSSEEQAAAERARGLKEEATGLSRELLGESEREILKTTSDISTRKDTIAKEQQKRYDELKKALETGEISQDMAKYFPDITELPVLSEQQIGDYLSKAPEASLASAVSSEELSKIKALQKLMGTQSDKFKPSFSPYESLEKPKEQKDIELKTEELKKTVDAYKKQKNFLENEERIPFMGRGKEYTLNELRREFDHIKASGTSPSDKIYKQFQSEIARREADAKEKLSPYGSIRSAVFKK
jgi:hypothetical protein